MLAHKHRFVSLV